MALNADTLSKLYQAFRPHAPIEETDAFQGRVTERLRVEEALVAPGLHVIIYGERGAGKTSLANVATSATPRVRVFCQKTDSFSALCKDILEQFNTDFNAKLVFDASTNTIRTEGKIFKQDSLTGNDLRSLLPKDKPLCIVLDELDRVQSHETVAEIAELCKNLSTYHQNVSLVMVGVAETADGLLKGHASNVRNLKQVHLGRMSTEELSSIIEHGEDILSIKFDSSVKERILDICDHFPYYLHLIAVNAAKATFERGTTTVSREDYLEGLRKAAQDCDESLRDVYQTAILSVKGSEIYRRVIWAMADIPTSVATVSTISERVNGLALIEGGEEVTVQTVGQAIKRLIDTTKKNILITKDSGFYGFTNPLMRGYIRLEREQI